MKEVCEICLHTITNPICVSCYLVHVRSWLRDFGLGEKEIQRSINKIKLSLPRETLNEQRCIICGKEKVSVCLYCAFLRTSRTILKLANEQAKSAFEESSNFGFEEEYAGH